MTDLTTTHEDGTDNNQGQVTQVEIDWEMVDIEELKKGYLRQSDYTRKTQELAELRKQQETAPAWDENDDVVAAKDFVRNYLEELWLADLPTKLKREQNDKSFDEIVQFEPTLKQQESAIKKIAEVEWLSIEDVIKNYNFLSSDKLEKAKQSRQIVGKVWFEEPKQKTLETMTPAEYEAFKASLKWR